MDFSAYQVQQLQQGVNQFPLRQAAAAAQRGTTLNGKCWWLQSRIEKSISRSTQTASLETHPTMSRYLQPMENMGKQVAPLQPVEDRTRADTSSTAHGGPHAAGAGALQKAAALVEPTLEQEPQPMGDPQWSRFIYRTAAHGQDPHWSRKDHEGEGTAVVNHYGQTTTPHSPSPFAAWGAGNEGVKLSLEKEQLERWFIFGLGSSPCNS